MDFLTESLCGKALVKLVSKGSTITAELLKMSTKIPKLFLQDGTESEMIKVILMDFKYFKKPKEIEDFIAAKDDYLLKDLEIKEEYNSLIEKFVRLFESIIRYHED